MWKLADYQWKDKIKQSAWRESETKVKETKLWSSKWGQGANSGFGHLLMLNLLIVYCTMYSILYYMYSICTIQCTLWKQAEQNTKLYKTMVWRNGSMTWYGMEWCTLQQRVGTMVQYVHQIIPNHRVWYDMVWYGMVGYGLVWYGLVW